LASSSGRSSADRKNPGDIKLRAAIVSTCVGVVILVLGFVGFLISGQDWVVLAVAWSAGLFHLGMVAIGPRMARRRSGKAGVSS
jgi:hypothetical protein